MPEIFVSYSRRDAAVVDELRGRLEAAGYDVWIDREDIQGGDQWRRAIVNAVEQCDTFIIILSSSSAGSDNVRIELDLAKDAKKRIIPLLVGQTLIPPEMKYQLAGLQFIDMSVDFETGLAQLLRALGGGAVPQPITHTAGLSIPSRPPIQLSLDEIRGKAFVLSLTRGPDFLSVGQDVWLSFEIQSGLSFPVEVWLGATVVDSQGAEHYNVTQDKTVLLEPGIHQYQRVLTLPLSAASGQACVYGGVWIGRCGDSSQSALIAHQQAESIYVTGA